MRACRPASCAATSPSSSASWPTTTWRRTRSSSTSASPACRSTGPSAASRTRQTRRSTCAWTPRRRARRRTSSTRRASASSRRSSAGYGEERFSRQIARAIVRRREEQPFERTTDLVEVVRGAIPAPRALRRRPSGQARLPGAAHRRQRGARGRSSRRCPRRSRLLRPGGRLAVISFHSLEDRIVKRFFAAQARGCTCPPDLPDLRVRQGADAQARGAQGRSSLAGRDGRESRAPSARLRVAIKT